MNKVPEYSYTIIASGNSQVHDEAALLAKVLEESLTFHGKDLPDPMKVSSSVRNDWRPLAVLGFTIFVSQRLGGKFLDDVYTQILQLRIKPLLAKIDQKLNIGNRKAKKAFVVSVWYSEHNVLVSVSVVGKTFDEVDQQLHLVPGGHTNALYWIAANGAGKPVHHYTVEDGKVNVAPVLLDRFDELLRTDKTG